MFRHAYVSTVTRVVPKMNSTIFRQSTRRYFKSKPFEDPVPSNVEHWINNNSNYIIGGVLIGGISGAILAGKYELDRQRDMDTRYYKKSVGDVYFAGALGTVVGVCAGGILGVICAGVGTIQTIAGAYVAYNSHMYLKEKIEN